MIEQLKVGEPLLKMQGRPQGIVFDISYPTIELIYNMQNPTANEIEQMSQGHAFEIRAVELNDIIVLPA